MTGGKDETWSPVEMSVARRRPWSVVADCSTPALQPQETRGHRELIDGLTVPASSESRQSADGDEQQSLMSDLSMTNDLISSIYIAVMDARRHGQEGHLPPSHSVNVVKCFMH